MAAAVRVVGTSLASLVSSEAGTVRLLQEATSKKTKMGAGKRAR